MMRRFPPRPMVCTRDFLCPIWGHVKITRLTATRRRMSHLTPAELRPADPWLQHTIQTAVEAP